MKVKKNSIRKLIKEELEAVIVTLSDESSADSLVPILCSHLGNIRAYNVWSHAAHQVTKGTGFLGDHIHLYGEIYQNLVEEYDKAAEKFISLTDDEGVACPHRVMKHALESMEKFPSPNYQPADEIAKIALQMTSHHKSCIEELYKELDSRGHLTLGMDDFLSASYNIHEKYCYLLKQRLKK